MKWGQDRQNSALAAQLAQLYSGRFAPLSSGWDPAQAALLQALNNLGKGTSQNFRGKGSNAKGQGKGQGSNGQTNRRSFPPSRGNQESPSWRTSGPQEKGPAPPCLRYEDGSKVKVRHVTTHEWKDGAFACHGCQGQHYSHHRANCAHCGMKRNKEKELKVIPNSKKPVAGAAPKAQAPKPGPKVRAAPKQEAMEIDSEGSVATTSEVDPIYVPIVLLHQRNLKKMILNDVPMAVARKGNLTTTSVGQRSAEMARLQELTMLQEMHPSAFKEAEIAATAAALQALVAKEEPTEPQALRNRGDMVLILGFHKTNMIKAKADHAKLIEDIDEALMALNAKKADYIATEAMRLQTDLLLEEQLAIVAAEGDLGIGPIPSEALPTALPTAETVQPLLQLLLDTAFKDTSKYGCLPEAASAIGADIMSGLLTLLKDPPK
jgi:hypothetical protein